MVLLLVVLLLVVLLLVVLVVVFLLLLLLLLTFDWINNRVPSDWQANKLKICKLEGKVDRGGRVVQYLHKEYANARASTSQTDR